MKTSKLSNIGFSVAVACAALFGLLSLPRIESTDAAAHHPTSIAQAERALSFSDPHPAPEPTPPGIRVLSSDAQGVTLELTTPTFERQPSQSDSAICERITVPGYGTLPDTGKPALPAQGALMGIPAQSTVDLQILEVESAPLPGAHDLCPVATPIYELESDPMEGLHYQGVRSDRDVAVYNKAALYPASPAELLSTGFIRSQRVASVRFHPFQVNPVTGEVIHLRRIRVRLWFEDPIQGTGSLEGAGASVLPPDEGDFEDVLRHALVNYNTARAWRASQQSSLATAQYASATLPKYKLLVDTDGIYRVSGADMVSAGADLSEIIPDTLRLLNQGQEIALALFGTEDGQFDPEDELLFYGTRLGTHYSITNVYWLDWGVAQGARMGEIDGSRVLTGAVVPTTFLARKRAEVNQYYLSNYPSGPTSERWYWMLQFATNKTITQGYPINLPNVATGAYSATVRGLFRGYAAVPEHHTRIYLNSYAQMIDDTGWPPQTELLFEATVPQSYLVQGTNRITVVNGINVTQDAIFVNWLEVDYHSTYTASTDEYAFEGEDTGPQEYQVAGFVTETLNVFDITTPNLPARVLNADIEGSGPYTLSFQHTISESHRYLALSPARYRKPLIVADTPSDLRSAANGADYIIVTHRKFYTATEPLAAYRQAQGLRVALVDVQDIYDEFNDGLLSPEAIRAFLAYAYNTWQPPAPLYVLLVGDGTYDFLNHSGKADVNYVPPYLAPVDPWMGETAADNRYVAIVGNDIFPDVHLGRLSAYAVSQVEAMVAKIIAYEQSPAPGDWTSQVLFVADNADSGGPFPALSDAIADFHLPATYTRTKVYYSIAPHTSTVVARRAITTAINSGQLMLNYIGHGSTIYWANEKLLDIPMIGELRNGGRMPFVVPMTCLEGYYIEPSSATTGRSAIAEVFVRRAGGGAIASWSPTGLGVADGHDFMNRALYDAIFFDGVLELGPATTLGKLGVVGQGHNELLDTYILFGDPALRLNAALPDLAIHKQGPGEAKPGATLVYTLTYTNQGDLPASGIAITDHLPSAVLSYTYSHAATAVTTSGQVVWTLPGLAPDESGRLIITATLSPMVRAPVTNTAWIGGVEGDKRPANNISTATTIIHTFAHYLPLVLQNWP